MKENKDFTERSDATIDYKSALTQQLDRLYPLLQNNTDLQKLTSPTSHEDFENEIHFGSFIWTEILTDFEKNVLKTTLTLASKDPNRLAYCSHAKIGHLQTFESAIKLFNLNLDRENPKIKYEFSIGEKYFHKEGKPTHRLQLETEWEPKSFARPTPLIKAYGISDKLRGIEKSKTNQDKIRTSIRDIAKINGLPMAIFTAFYCGVRVDTLINDIFNEKKFKEFMEINHIVLPTHKRVGDANKLHAIRESIMDEGEHGELFPVLNSQGFKTAIELMKGAPWANVRCLEACEFQEVKLDVKSYIVLLGLPEVAMEIADPQFKDPIRTSHIIENYHHRVTTLLITAFMPFKQELPQWEKIFSKDKLI
jgi:hypothetical protein